MYAKACHHIGIVSKSMSPCQRALMVSSSLKLGFWFNPSASQLTLPCLWIISKSYSYKINAHLAKFPMSQSNSIKNFKRWLSYHKITLEWWNSLENYKESYRMNLEPRVGTRDLKMYFLFIHMQVKPKNLTTKLMLYE